MNNFFAPSRRSPSSSINYTISRPTSSTHMMVESSSSFITDPSSSFTSIWDYHMIRVHLMNPNSKEEMITLELSHFIHFLRLFFLFLFTIPHLSLSKNLLWLGSPSFPQNHKHFVTTNELLAKNEDICQ